MDETIADCQPIGFDNVDQLEDLLSRLRSCVKAHIEEQCKGKQPGYQREMEQVIEQEVLAKLPLMIQQNINIRGLSWEEEQAKSSQATQPVDSALLRATIEAQDAAFALSSLACIKRSNKTTQLAGQVETRLRRVMDSGEEKSALLREQRKRRDGRRRLVGGDIPAKQETANDLRATEELLKRSSEAISSQILKAQRATDVAAEVRHLARGT